jgi:hypothetical protein
MLVNLDVFGNYFYTGIQIAHDKLRGIGFNHYCRPLPLYWCVDVLSANAGNPKKRIGVRPGQANVQRLVGGGQLFYSRSGAFPTTEKSWEVSQNV